MNNADERCTLYSRSVTTALKFPSIYGEIPPKTSQWAFFLQPCLMGHSHCDQQIHLYLPSLSFSTETLYYNRPSKLLNLPPNFILQQFSSLCGQKFLLYVNPILLYLDNECQVFCHHSLLLIRSCFLQVSLENNA